MKNHILWKFQLCSQESMIVPIWRIIGFQQRDIQDSRNMNEDIFCRLSVTSCQCIIGTKKYRVSGILLNYDVECCIEGYGQIKEVFRASTKDDISQPFISDLDFRSSNVRADHGGYIIYVFDIRYQQCFTVSQPIKLEFKFDGVVPNDINGYALVLTNKLVSLGSDG